MEGKLASRTGEPCRSHARSVSSRPIIDARPGGPRRRHAYHAQPRWVHRRTRRPARCELRLVGILLPRFAVGAPRHSASLRAERYSANPVFCDPDERGQLSCIFPALSKTEWVAPCLLAISI